MDRCYDEPSSFCELTLSLDATFYDAEHPYPDDEMQFRYTSVIPDHAVSKSHNPERHWSAGHILGQELGRIARQMRAHICDWDDVIDGFKMEMREPY